MDILTQIGLPVGIAAAIVLLGYLVRPIINFISERRSAVANEEMRRKLDYLDLQLSEFYLPITARFEITEGLNDFFISITGNGPYKNEILSIQATNPHALRNIVVRKIFLPLNREIESLIIDKGHWKADKDNTNLSVILRHLVLWRALEESIIDGSISEYNAKSILQFPVDEAKKFRVMCSNLVNNRNKMRAKLLHFSGIPN